MMVLGLGPHQVVNRCIAGHTQCLIARRDLSSMDHQLLMAVNLLIGIPLKEEVRRHGRGHEPCGYKLTVVPLESKPKRAEP